MKNKKVISIIIASTLLLSFAIMADASQNKHITNFDKGTKLIELKQSAKDSKTVAIVDGQEI